MRLRAIPFIGRVLAWPLACVRWKRHERTALVPIGRAICDQMRSRPLIGPWPSDPPLLRVAQAVSEAVAREKDLDGASHGGPDFGRRGPALHPDDPMPLLLWGPVDDWTPLLLFGEFERPQFGVPRDVTREAVERAWFEAWTCRRFVEHIAELCREHEPRPSGSRPG